ncbi:MAG TPA: sulfotransferase [Caldilineae bacterium]|nr:sulfotransferase [Caldilineae bacterium]
MPSSPIIVLSFGRSGSTWVSDIISKSLGGLLLFEPLHPETCSFAAEICYGDAADPAMSERLAGLLAGILAKQDRNRWLLRNHLFSPLEEVSQTFVDTVWDECEILGFKEIRATFLIDWLLAHLHARIVYLVRHPYAVIASLHRRRNFWNEFGFARHWRLFQERVLLNPRHQALLQPYQPIIAAAQTQTERETVMWAATHKIASADLARHGLPIFHYEDFYEKPFPTTRALLSYLGHDASIHPAHIFVPSMTTIRTVHGLSASESDYSRKGLAIFWQDILSPTNLRVIGEIVQAFDIHDYDGRLWA